MGGGLGDIFNWLFMHDAYANFDILSPDEKVTIALTCGNPGAQELFKWHPKAAQIEVHNFGFLMPDGYAIVEKKHNFPKNTPTKYGPQKNLKFYPAPSDRDILNSLESVPYVVLNIAAGHPDRSIPGPVYNSVIETITTYQREHSGLKVVLVGRIYDNHDRPEHNHREPIVGPKEGLINLIDKVTVPATLEIIRRSVGVVCCHSAVCLASWYLKKPTFLLYPKEWGDTQINNPQSSPYKFGKDFKTTRHIDFEHYNSALMMTFLDIATMQRSFDDVLKNATIANSSMVVSPEDRLRDTIFSGLEPDPWNAMWKQVPKYGGQIAVELEVGELLSAMVRATKPEIVVETGTFLGFSSLMIASALKRNERGHLYTIDRHDFNVMAEMRKFELDSWATFVHSDSRAALSELVKRVGKIDLLWLDSEAEKTLVLEELEAAMPAIRPGTIIAFHDTIYAPEVESAISEIEQRFPRWQSLSFKTSRGFHLMKAK